MSGGPDQAQHPDLSSGYGGGVPGQIWTIFGNAQDFAIQYGWHLLFIAVVGFVFWPSIEPVYWRFLKSFDRTPPVTADPAAVTEARRRQQDKVMREAAEAKKLRDAEESAKKLAGDKPKRPAKMDYSMDDRSYKSYDHLGGGGGGGGGGGYRPQRRRPPGGGGS
jgi:hypothetical protein